MSWILDVIIVAIIGLTVFFGFKNGFVKTSVSAISCILAIVLTIYFSAPLAEYLKQTALSKSIENITEQTIEDMMLTESFNMESLVKGESERFNKLVKISGVDEEQLASWFETADTNVKNARKELAKKIAGPIIDVMAMIIAIFSIYVGTQVVLAILAFILDKIANLPSLKKYNKGFGAVLGLLIAFVRVGIFCFVADAFINNADFLGNDVISALNPDNTLVFKFFNDINIFSYIFS